MYGKGLGYIWVYQNLPICHRNYYILSLIRFDVRANLDYMPEYKNSEKTEEMDYKVDYLTLLVTVHVRRSCNLVINLYLKKIKLSLSEIFCYLFSHN
jgi:hypothetical protein